VRQGGVLANLLGSHAELSLTRNGASQHVVACLFHRRSRFAADHRFIYIGSIGSHETLCLGNHAIHRNLLAGSYFYHVAYLNGGNRNFLHLVVVGAFYLLVSYQSGGFRLHSHQLANAARRTVLCLFFQASAGQHEGDDHHGSIEISVPFYASRSPYHFSEEGVEGAEEEGDEGAERHERIHVCRMMQELLPGGNIKLFAAVEQVGECQEQTNLIGEGTRMMSRGNAI